MRHRLRQVTENAALALTLLLASALSTARSGHPATPPADWGPVFSNLKNIPYPYSLQFLGHNILGQACRYAPSGEDVDPGLVEIYRAKLAKEQRRIFDWKPEFLEHVRIRYSYALNGEYPRLQPVRSLNPGLSNEPMSGYWPQIENPHACAAAPKMGRTTPTSAAPSSICRPTASCS